jgi:3-oxoacyl-[acyl-carrier protein] reductase
MIKGKTALVTGASRGIGRDIALELARQGVRICINYLSSHDQAEEVANQIRSEKGEAFTVAADVSITEEVDRLIDKVKTRFGEVDICINNAGVSHRDELSRIREDDWDRILRINLKSAFLTTQACLPGMREKQWGRIVFISSVAAQTGGVTGPLYCASKAGMIGLMHSYAALLVKEGITSNAVTPALIDTDMVRKLKVDTSKIPMGRFGTTVEVAEAVMMLVRNSYITGQTINVNGGWYFS